MSRHIELNENTPSIQYLSLKDKKLSKLISLIGSITYDLVDDEYSFLIQEIIEQMLSQKAGKKIFERLIKLCDGDVTPKNISNLTDSQIKSIGTSTKKVEYIRNITNLTLNNSLNFAELNKLSDKDVHSYLINIPGIGNWTANMYLIFALDRQNILPYDDAAFLQAYCWLYDTNDKSKNAVLKQCKIWEPYSSIAARYLYHALNTGMVKVKF